MPSQTLSVSGNISLAGKTNFVIDKFWSAGGRGDNSPAQGIGFAATGSPGGGGGACLSGVPIPANDLETAKDNNTLNLVIVLGAPGVESSIALDFGGALVLSPGEDGNTCTGSGDQAEGGKLITDSSSWVTNHSTMLSEGAPGLTDNSTTAGWGGGGAGGISGVAAHSNSNQTGGTAVGTGGAGGNGGNLATNGTAGAAPGGGGGGAGLGVAKTGGTGGAASATISWDTITGGCAAKIPFFAALKFTSTRRSR